MRRLLSDNVCGLSSRGVGLDYLFQRWLVGTDNCWLKSLTKWVAMIDSVVLGEKSDQLV